VCRLCVRLSNVSRGGSGGDADREDAGMRGGV